MTCLDVFFIATANSADTIPEPLLDRMEVISISGYTEEEKFQIASRHLVSQVLEDHGIGTQGVHFSDQTILDIIRSYTREAGVRGLQETAFQRDPRPGTEDRHGRAEHAAYRASI